MIQYIELSLTAVFLLGLVGWAGYRDWKTAKDFKEQDVEDEIHMAKVKKHTLRATQMHALRREDTPKSTSHELRTLG